MVRLSEIPPETLEQIRKFLLENKDKYPVTTRYKGEVKTLPELVEEKFGIRLSPGQVYTLLKGHRKYTLTLDVDLIRDLEEHFGSVSRGIRQLLKVYQGHRLDPELRKYLKILLSKGEPLTAKEIEELLLPEVGDVQKVWKIVGELVAKGYVSRDSDGRYVVTEYPRDPFIAALFGMFGGR